MRMIAELYTMSGIEAVNTVYERIPSYYKATSEFIYVP